MKTAALFAIAILLLCIVACSKQKTAKAELKDAQGNLVGTATFTEVPDGVKISLDASNLTPGQHGIHIHSVGKCEGPSFATAGGHFNPDNKQHGSKNPQGMHAGDIPNITVGADGKVKTELTVKNVNLGDGQNSLLRQGGTSLVIHAQPDDEMTEPSGNSGARIACGVIQGQ